MHIPCTYAWLFCNGQLCIPCNVKYHTLLAQSNIQNHRCSMRGILFAALLHAQELDGECWKDMPWVLKNDMLKRCALQLWLSVYYLLNWFLTVVWQRTMYSILTRNNISVIVQENFKRIKRRNFPRCNMLNTTCNIDLLLNTRCINLYLHDLLCLCFCYTDKPRATKINHDLRFGLIVRQWGCW